MPELPPVLPGDDAAVDRLAHALALALNDNGTRRQVLEDLRDSPFPQHKLHLPSYLRGQRGALLVAKMAEVGAINPDAIQRTAETRGGLQLAMPRALDRMFWAGTPDIAVKGTPFTLVERNGVYRTSGPVEKVYTTQGIALSHGPFSESAFPFLVIGPIDVVFGADPEAQRAAAPSQTRATVSTPEKEIEQYRQKGDSLVSLAPDGRSTTSLSSTSCDPATAVTECPDEGGTGGAPGRLMGVTLPSGKNFDQCYRPGQFDTSVDRDQDGVDDGCEAELAYEFRPHLVLMSNDCDTRHAPYFASRYAWSNAFGDVIVIFYALSYVYDCGPPLPCGSDFPTCDTHRGDSEWIIVEVGRYTSSTRPWALKYATLSAHWKTENDQTAGYEAADLEDAVGSPGFGAPRVWVAEDKHANYRTQRACDSSGWGNFDNCDLPRDDGYPIDIAIGYNLGSSAIPFRGALNSAIPDRLTNNPYVEYYWENGNGQGFCGWSYYTTGKCSGGYDISLNAYRF